MKTRFSSLVLLKKNKMKKSEQFVQQASVNVNNANTALEQSYKSLDELSAPNSGRINEMLAVRHLLTSQRENIEHNKGWVNFAKNELQNAKERFKADTLEYEKFQYLELQEIKKELLKIKIKESKELDEIAIMTYAGKNR